MDTKEKNISIGIDLCSDYSQISYFNHNLKEPVSVEFSGSMFIPTVVSKTIGKDEWFAGEDAEKSAKLGETFLVRDLLKKAIDKELVTVDDKTVMPISLLSGFFEYLIMSVKATAEADGVDYVCVTIADYNISLLNVIVKALESLGIQRDRIITLSHDESFIYYAFNQKEELRKNDNFLFEYGEDGLNVKRLYTTVERGTTIAMVHSDDFSEVAPFSMIKDKEFADSKLKEIASALFDKKSVSTVYLTGSAFGSDMSYPEFVKVICDRKRAFAGNNLYCKGACYAAYENTGNNVLRDVILACRERITTGIELKIQDHGRDKILRMIRPGTNWFGADCSFEFIVDDVSELELFLSPIDTREKQLVRISLNDLPKRPNKATRITLSFSFTSDSRCHMMVKDMGFGEFFASSGRIINEELLL